MLTLTIKFYSVVVEIHTFNRFYFVKLPRHTVYAKYHKFMYNFGLSLVDNFLFEFWNWFGVNACSPTFLSTTQNF